MILRFADLYLSKWCFQTSLEEDLINNDPCAAHLIFLQARHDLETGEDWSHFYIKH